MPIADSTIPDASSGEDQVEFVNFDQWFEDGSYAYFIGISKFNDERIHTLNSPENDINSLRAVLEDKNKHGFTVREVTLHKEQQTISLPNPLLNPTKQHVLDFVTNIKCQEDSRVIVYFAGHGIAENTDVDEKPAGFLIPTDAQLGNQSTYVKMSDIHDALSKLNCRHLLIILDCCYAGAFRWADTKRSLYTGKSTTIYYQKFLQFTTNKVRQVITSTSADQQALDTFGNRGETGVPNSPFAQSLIAGLNTGGADFGSSTDKADGIITVSELGIYLKDNLNNLQLKQIPAVWNIGDNTKGEFIFLNPALPKRVLLRFGKNRSNPYKGLAAYSIEDKNIFFGRQRVLDGWKEGNIASPGLTFVVNNNHVIAVTGRSGIGKSSLVMAGILSACNENIVKKIKPGARPYTDHKLTLDETINSTVPIYLFVDQYEELVTNCTDENERNQFEQALLKLSEIHKVIVTLRSDFEIQFKQSPLIGQSATFYAFPIPPFTRDDIKEIVTGVAGQQALEFKSESGTNEADDIFTNRIIDEAYAYPDSLPLLSLALSRLFDKRDSDANGNIEYLTEKEYNSFKGIKGIIEELADIEYRKYADTQGNTNATDTASIKQKLLMQLIFRMISFEGAEITKRRLYKKYTINNQEINELDFADNITTETITDMCEGLISARLLKSDKDEQGNEYIEPAHEALLRSWPELTKALKKKDGQNKIPEEQRITNQNKVVLLRQVSELARQFYFANPIDKKDLLWIKDYRLMQILKLQGVDLRTNKIEDEFIHASDKARKRNAFIKNSLVISSLAASLIIAIVFFFLYKNIQRKNNAIQDKLVQGYWDQGINAAEQNEILKSMLYSSEALININDEATKKELLFSTANTIPFMPLQQLININKEIKKSHISGDGKLILTISTDSSLQVWDALSEHLSATPLYQLNKVEFAVFSNDSKKILLIANSTLYVLFISNRFQKTSVCPGTIITAAAFCYDNQTIIAAKEDGNLYKWQQNNQHYKETLVGLNKQNEEDDNRIYEISISKDSTWIITSNSSYMPFSQYPVQRSIWLQQNDSTYTLQPNINRDDESTLFAANASSEKILFSNTSAPSIIFNTKIKSSASISSFTGFIRKAAFIGNSDSLLLTTAKGITVWNGNNYPTKFFNTDSKAIAFLSPDNYHILVFTNKGNISIYNTKGEYLGFGNHINNVTEFETMAEMPIIYGGNDFEFSNNGQSIITYIDSTVYLYHLLPTSMIPQPKKLSNGMHDIYPDVNAVILNNNNDSFNIWDMDAASPMYHPLSINTSFNDLKNDLLKTKKYTLASSPGTPAFYVKTITNHHYLIDFSKDTAINLQDMNNGIIDNPFNTNGQQIIYTLKNNSTHLRNAPQWKDETIFGNKKMLQAAFLNNGKNIITTSTDSIVQLWNNDQKLNSPLLSLPKTKLIAMPDNGKWFMVQQAKQSTIYYLTETGNIEHSTLAPTSNIDFSRGKDSNWVISPDGVWIYFLAPFMDYYTGRLYNTSDQKIWYSSTSNNPEINLYQSIVRFSNNSKYFTQIPQKNKKGFLNFNSPLKIFSLNNLNETDSVLPQYGKTIKISSAIYDLQFCNYNNNIIRITNKDSIGLYDIIKGKSIAQFGNATGASLSRDGEKLYTWNSQNNLAMYSADLDIPATLYKKQAIVLSGIQLNAITSDMENLTPSQWQILKNQYLTESARHYKTCKYKYFNVWARLYPLQAAKL